MEWPSWISEADFQAGSKDDLLKEATKVIDSLKNELNHVKADHQSSQILHGTLSFCAIDLLYEERELHEIEMRHVAVLSTNKSLQQQTQDLEKDKDTLREQVEGYKKKSSELTKANDDARGQLTALKDEVEKLSQDKLALVDVVAKKDSELESLHSTIQEREAQYTTEREESTGNFSCTTFLIVFRVEEKI